jgi:hypothetical protein
MIVSSEVRNMKCGYKNRHEFQVQDRQTTNIMNLDLI